VLLHKDENNDKLEIKELSDSFGLEMNRAKRFNLLLFDSSQSEGNSATG